MFESFYFSSTVSTCLFCYRETSCNNSTATDLDHLHDLQTIAKFVDSPDMFQNGREFMNGNERERRNGRERRGKNLERRGKEWTGYEDG